jgi:lipoprotein-anchoring transpeptidase ErfK/SrfK
MTPDRHLLARTSRRSLIILTLAAIILVALAGVVWAASGAASLPWRGLLSLSATEATATPTRTPRPETVTPPTATVDLAIVLPTATPQPTATAAPTAAPPATAEPLTPYLIEVVKRYGMDMSRRFVVVDLASQTLTVWDPGQRPRIMPVSTGDETRGYRTLAWYGLVGDYWGTFQSSGVYADEGWYLFHDAGHILIHGTPYRLVDGTKVYEDMDALGAYPASKGCIRLAPEDAVWFTEWNPKGVPIVILPKDEGLGIN